MLVSFSNRKICTENIAAFCLTKLGQLSSTVRFLLAFSSALLISVPSFFKFFEFKWQPILTRTNLIGKKLVKILSDYI